MRLFCIGARVWSMLQTTIPLSYTMAPAVVLWRSCKTKCKSNEGTFRLCCGGLKLQGATLGHMQPTHVPIPRAYTTCSKQCSREVTPLIPAWAITIHRFQIIRGKVDQGKIPNPMIASCATHTTWVLRNFIWSFLYCSYQEPPHTTILTDFILPLYFITQLRNAFAT
jgi:hypothetical protein